MLSQVFNEDAGNSIGAARIHGETIKPLYDSYCFSRLPQTIRWALTGDGQRGLPASTLRGLPTRYKKVILLLLDAFGWCFVERYAEALPFLQRMMRGGVVSKLTTQFPSTTAAQITTLYSGLPVGDTGVFEWFYFEPVLDRIFAPLLCATIGPTELEPVPEPVPVEALYPAQSLSRSLADVGIQSYSFLNQAYARSSFTTATLEGSRIIPFKTLPEAVVNLSELVVEPVAAPTYYCLYVDTIDAISHRYGPASRQVDAEIRTLFGLFESVLGDVLDGGLEDTLVLLSADHGQIGVDTKSELYVDELVPRLETWIRTNEAGQLLVPAGSSRDMFLYIRPEHLDDARFALQKALGERAVVRRTADLVDEGYFGATSPRLLERLGDLVVFPRGNGMVWWRGAGRFQMEKRGHHGGLTAEEMETVLFAAAR